jgi:hypothetical protein
VADLISSQASSAAVLFRHTMCTVPPLFATSMATLLPIPLFEPGNKIRNNKISLHHFSDYACYHVGFSFAVDVEIILVELFGGRFVPRSTVNKKNYVIISNESDAKVCTWCIRASPWWTRLQLCRRTWFRLCSSTQWQPTTRAPPMSVGNNYVT